MKHKFLALLLAGTVMAMPCTANASILDLSTFIETIQYQEQIIDEGYTQANLNFRSMPDLTANIIDVVDVNTEITYMNYDNEWVMAIYNDQIGFFAKKYIGEEEVEIEEESKYSYDAIYSASYFKRMGVINWNGWRWTWYSQNVLPGGGLNIPGRHVNDNGYVCDGDGYICLASSTLSKGCVVDTPFGGPGKVYDSGCNSDTLDVYVAW